MIDSFTQHFTKKPDDMAGYTMIVCSHAYHGTYHFYVKDEDFQSSLMHIIRTAWVNGFVMMIYPATY